MALGVFWGTVLAVAFARYPSRPARAFLATTLPLLAQSLLGPLTADVIVPVVARRLVRSAR